jgi:hypothetical protein
MFYNLRKSINTRLFNLYVRKAIQCPPVRSSPDSKVNILTQLCSRDLMMYLVAIKTFSYYVPPKSVVIVADRLNEKEINILHSQIENLTIINLDEVNDNRFPKGGCWERLQTILKNCVNNFVIQLDADTITLKTPTEVLKCINENKCFTLGTDMGQSIIDFKQATKLIKSQNITSNHVQVQAELAMEQVDINDRLKYVRGCAGFAGFSKNALNLDQLGEICEMIESNIGSHKWREWGSEQVASNIVIANSLDPLVLPITKYHYFKPGRNIDDFDFLHFVGSHRFQTNDYAKLAAEQINRLFFSA